MHSQPLEETFAVDKRMKSVYNNLLHKPIYLATYDWSTVHDPDLALINVRVPNIFFQSDLLKRPFQMNAKWRGTCKFLLQVQGTPFHSGTLAAVVVPFGTYSGYRQIVSKINYNHIALANPILLAANDSTQAELEVPFYCATDTAVCRTQTAFNTIPDYFTYDPSSAYTAELLVLVVMALAASDGASTTIRVNLSVVFDNLEFYVPSTYPSMVVPTLESIEEKEEHDNFTIESNFISQMIDKAVPLLKQWTADGIDLARGALKFYTGLDNPTLSVPNNSVLMWNHNPFNNVQGVDFYERMTYYPSHVSTAQVDQFNSEVEECDFSHIVSKLGVIGSMGFTSSAAAGELLFSCPVTPFPFSMQMFDSPCSMAPMSLAYASSKYWSGGINFNIYSNMVFSQNANLVAYVLYSPIPVYGVPLMSSLAGCPTWQMEFSGGNQEYSFTVPYNAVTEVLPTTLHCYENAFQHAMLYIFLKTPPSTSAAAPARLRFLIRAGGAEDLTFYGPKDNITGYTVITHADAGFKREVENFSQESLSSPLDHIVEPPLEICSCTTKILTKGGKKRLVRNMKPIESVRDIYKQFRTYSNYTIDNPSLGIPIFLGVHQLIFSGAGTTSNSVIHKLLPNTYFAYNGGVRIKILSPIPLYVAYVYPMYKIVNDPVDSNINTIMSEDSYPNVFKSALGGIPSNFLYEGYTTYQTKDHFIEFEAPCEMHWRFHKNPMLDNMNDYVDPIPLLTPAASMGYIMIRALDISSTAVSKIEISTAITDEGHFGMQCLNPIVQCKLTDPLAPVQNANTTPTLNADNTLYLGVNPDF